MIDKFQVFNLISSQGDVNCDYYIVSIGYLTSVGPCGWCDALSSIQTYDLVTPVAIETLPSTSNGNLASTGVVELPKQVSLQKEKCQFDMQFVILVVDEWIKHITCEGEPYNKFIIFHIWFFLCILTLLW